jgi:hypothetical protein
MIDVDGNGTLDIPSVGVMSLYPQPAGTVCLRVPACAFVHMCTCVYLRVRLCDLCALVCACVCLT